MILFDFMNEYPRNEELHQSAKKISMVLTSSNCNIS